MDKGYESFGIAGRIALVSGGNRNIGRAIALTLAKAGATPLILYGGDEEAARKVCAEIEKQGARTGMYQADLADTKSLAPLVRKIEKEVGGIDILVNNAAINPLKPIDGYDLAEWDRVQAINAKAAVALAQACVPSMKRKGWGQVINICSVTLNGGWSDFTSYVASKGTLLGLTRAMARELGQFGIRVNAISPGAIPTALEREVWADQLDTYVKFLIDHQALIGCSRNWIAVVDK